MEVLNNYNFKGYNFSLWFFRIMMSMVVITIVLLFVLQINETVTIREGEIVSSDPQADFKAPYDAQVLNILVKEGQSVKKGDTLIVMENPDYKEQMAKTETEIEYLQKKISSTEVLQNAVQQKRAAIDQTSAIAGQKYQLDINRLQNEIKSMDAQYNLQKEKLSSASEKYAADSILYKKDMLSKYELNNTKDASSNVKENLTLIQAQRNKQLSEKSMAYNEFTREQNNLQLNKVQLVEYAQSLIQAKNDLESQLIQAQQTLTKLKGELNKFNVIATTSGVVNYLFNTKNASNMIAKGELLVSVAPQSASYYAKVYIPEKDMSRVRAGLGAQIKTDAYQASNNSMLTGQVTYVSERKENEKFYALVNFSEAPKVQLRSGYGIYGEIIVERLPLYRYFIKKLFKRFDN